LEIFEDPVAVRSGSPKTNEHPQEMCGPTRKPPREYGLRRQSIVFRVTKRSANGSNTRISATALNDRPAKAPMTQADRFVASVAAA
jgi:hypothetical protein